MGITRVQITDMPGPGLLEFLLQWGGLFLQAAAAAGTLWAVIVALRVAQRSEQLRTDDYEERGAIVAGVVIPEVMAMLNTLVALTDQVSAFHSSLEEPSNDTDSSTNLENAVGRRKNSPCDAEEQRALARTQSFLQMNATQRLFDHLHFMPQGKGRHIAAALGSIESLHLHVGWLIRECENPSGLLPVAVQGTLAEIGVVANHLLFAIPSMYLPSMTSDLSNAIQEAEKVGVDIPEQHRFRPT